MARAKTLLLETLVASIACSSSAAFLCDVACYKVPFLEIVEEVELA